MNWTDKELGMDSRINRRDFMQGAAMAIAAAVTPPTSLFAQQAAEAQNTPGYDPPAAHGLRGSHPGSFEVAHRLRDGTIDQRPDRHALCAGAGRGGLDRAGAGRGPRPLFRRAGRP